MIDIVLDIYLPHFFNWVIETSIMASVLVGLILCVKTLLRKRLTPRWHYLLWMILIVRLLLPWSPGSSYSIYSILSYGYESITSDQSQPIGPSENERLHKTKSLSDSKVVINEEHPTIGTPQMIKESKEETMIRNEKQKDESLSIHTITLYLWLTGVIVLGFITYLVNRRLLRYIKQQPVMTDERIVKIFENCKKSMSIQQNIPILLAGEISSPTVLGFLRPRLLLSSDLINKLNEQQLRHIFHHELAHIKRSDVGLNWLMHWLLILNWFNPIIWFACVCMREDQELACDAYALTFMEEEEKISYGLTLINLLEHYSNYYQLPSLANLVRNKRTIKRRIYMIKKFQKKSYRWSALGVMAVVAVASLSLLNVQANGSNEEQKENITDKITIKEMEKEVTVSTKSPEDIVRGDKNTDENSINDQPNYAYIVLNGFYYKKTNEEVSSDQLGEQVGEVKRIGDWAIKKSGDTNEIPPGPIFSIKGRNDEYIVGKGVVFKNGQNLEGYLVFQKADKVKESNTNNILNAKGDPEETKIAFENVKQKIGTLFGFIDIDSRVNLQSVSYSEGAIVNLIYGIQEGDKKNGNDLIQGFLFIYQYEKSFPLKNSRFVKPVEYEMIEGENGTIAEKSRDVKWEKPKLIESFKLNGIEWGAYEDSYYNDLVIKGQTEKFNFEITTQGNFPIDKIKELLRFYKEAN
jgi:beta-lactamase regulating signal transducer with metallopeptidase domain